MTSTSLDPRPPQGQAPHAPVADPGILAGPARADRLYTRQFFQVFGAVALFMTGAALQFHFGQYVEYLGHGVDVFGRILSIGMTGTLLIRLRVGRWIDRFGCRPTWVAGTVLFATAVGCMQFATSVWLLTLLRVVSTMAFAAAMTTIPVFAAQIAPPRRRAESIGTIGLAGFSGMVIGPTIGDWIFAGATDAMATYRTFFSLSVACSVMAALVMTLIALPPSPGVEHARSSRPAASEGRDMSQLRVILRFWPGTVLLVGVVFSTVFCLQMGFLERLAEARGFRDIKVFFLVYGPTAMTLRILFRRLPEQIGRTRTVVGGLTLVAVGLLLLVGVQSQAELALPALLMGAGHSFVFPSMVDLAAERFPAARRGTGTALILGAGDVGLLIGFATLGEVIDAFGFDAALRVQAIVVLCGAMAFGWARRDAILARSGYGRGRQGEGL